MRASGVVAPVGETRKWWTTGELAKAAGVSANYVARLVRSGRLRGVRMGRDWYVDPDVGLQWLVERGGVREAGK